VPDEIIAQRRSLPDYLRYLAERGEFVPDPAVEEQVRHVLATTGQIRVVERVRPNGRVIEIHSNPVPGGGFVLIYSDITERKRNEAEIAAARDAAQEAARTIEAAFQELKIAQANLIQAEKMASLGQLTAGIAHEIKNPLNFVNNFASLSVDLLAELKEAAAPGFAALSEDQRAEIDDVSAMLTSNLQKITEHGKRADGIVKAMLEHSRGASGERREVDINALADEALNLAYHGARAQDQSFNVTLERDFGDGIAPIELNPQDITRVLLNLFGNGFYAANRRAKDGAAAGFSPALKLSTRDLGRAVEIRVRDNGTGIPEDIRDKLFQPFFTTKPTGEGTGLGLSITYDIVTKQHGGTIAVDSEVDRFTEFVVTLPRAMIAGEGGRHDRYPIVSAVAVRSAVRSSGANVPSRRITKRCSNVANTGLMADGFNRPAACHWPTQTSPTARPGRSWLVMAMTTMSGRVRLYLSWLTTTAGRFFDSACS